VLELTGVSQLEFRFVFMLSIGLFWGDLRSDTNSLTCGRTETRSGHLDSLLLAPRWQPKAKNVGADGNRHKLFAAHHVRHR